MITLRPICSDDRQMVLDILTDDTVKQTYMLPDYENRESAEPLFLRLMEMSRDHGKYVRVIALDDALIGFVNHTDIQNDAIELGYVIHSDFQGRGFMTQALKLAMDELFSLGYRQIISGAFSTNAASIRVMEKCGMRPMGKDEEIIYRGHTHKCVFYSIEKQE